MSDVPYQIKPQVEALKQERANAVAYGQTDRVAACDKQLASLGVKQEAAEKRAAVVEEKTEAPKGRRTRQQDQVAEATGEVS